eukprot:Protomagalhaensia_sp_Gyna_25__5874@NODE_885_length_2462_cov_6_996286_g698_i0_p2_GENE_NODE_885_length_2462_cov_6_996286_g698_i0NODE_885_length_2462_cov_6_996286_g698_i0_p2_ORF_typecomplete_len209_score33_87T4_deiodinase/PF00837_17/0_21_NODE_885_length_2462_cov_6_996286_g698_i016492275
MAENGYTYQPPLAGCIRGEEWNRYVDALWGLQKRSVIHTIVLPPGRNPRDLVFYKPRLLKQHRYIMERAEIPTTVSAPKPTFECYVDPSCTRVNNQCAPIPNHFIVIDAKLPERTMKIARQITADLEKQGSLPHQLRQASKEGNIEISKEVASISPKDRLVEAAKAKPVAPGAADRPGEPRPILRESPRQEDISPAPQKPHNCCQIAS